MARLRRQRLLGLVPVVGVAMFIPVAVLTAGPDRPWTATRVAVLLLPLGIVIVVLAAMYPLIRRQEQHTPLSFGADKNTQKAVQRALRTGEPADARIDALARDAATKTLRAVWPIRLIAGSLVVQIIAVGLQILSGASAAQAGPAVATFEEITTQRRVCGEASGGAFAGFCGVRNTRTAASMTTPSYAIDGDSMKPLRRAVGSVTMLLLTAVAAGTRPEPSAAASQATPAARISAPVESGKAASVRIITCRAKEYKTMKELAAESDIVIRGKALSETALDEIGNIPFVATTVEVTEAFRGATTGAHIKVRQMAASSAVVIEDVIPVLRPGNEYILHLTPSGLKGKADQYFITGGAGGFLYGADGTAERLDPMSTRLPKTITAATVRRSLKNPG